MPKPPLQDFVERHPQSATNRLVKRIQRFAGNTTDPDTSLAAEELVKMFIDAIAAGKKVAADGE